MVGMTNVPLLTPVTGVPGCTCPSWRKSVFQVNALAGSRPSSGSWPPPLKEITSPARKELPSTGDEIVATGGAPTLMVKGGGSVVFTPSETASLTVYRPSAKYVCAGLGAVDDAPSPKSHDQLSGCPSGSIDPAL